MPRLSRLFAACGLALAALPVPAAAQPGSVQVTAASHTVSGDPARTAGQAAFEPDIGVSWLRPGTRFRLFEIEMRGTSRDGQPHLGRAFLALRDFKHRGVKYTVEAGDSFFSPSRGDYQFRNLYTPSVNFAGVSLKATTDRTSLAVMAGRATAARNIFGTDTETLNQGLLIGQVTRKTTDRLELSARASRVRTRDLKEFIFTIADSDQAGGGARFALTPAVHLAGDASVVSYRRRGSDEPETDASALAGLSVLLARGWIQLNAASFSPGELPVLSQPLADRQTAFAAAEYDVLPRLRVFGGWESFRANVAEEAIAPSPPSDGSRAFGGLRVPLGSSSSAAVRIEQGDRRSRLVGAALTRVSDTGVASAELQSTIGRFSGFARFAVRDNVESDVQSASYTQREGSGLLFLNLTKDVQLFSSVAALHNVTREGGGHTFLQFGGGTQSRVLQRGLWFRVEGLASRHADSARGYTIPQQTFSLGLNGEIAARTVLAFNVYVDRLHRTAPNTRGGDPGLTAMAGATADAWMARSSVRITRTFSTGPAPSSSILKDSMARHSGTGSLNGIVFSDWNGNGQQDPDESPVENIPVRVANLANANTSRSGEFAFVNVPAGLHQIGIDLHSLPVDFDPPRVAQVQVDLPRGATRRLAFGLVPLGSISGRVVRDANENGRADPGEEAITGAVLVLNGGARSELARAGAFRFDAVRSGTHTVTLLPESLPEGSAIVEPASRTVEIGRQALAPETIFLVVVRERPELRRVFPPATGHDTPGSTRPRAGAAPAASPKGAPAREPATAAAPGAPRQQYAVQIAAFNDPSRAAGLVEELRREGFSAYLVVPPVSDPGAPYRVRVGLYDTHAAAEKEARAIEKRRGEKVWVIRER
jgi:cell division septation protein DedD